MLRRTLLSILLLLCLTRAASAWGTKEHIQMTRLAAERLLADPATPPAMKAWLKSAQPDVMDMAGEKEWFLHKHIGPFPRGADGLAFWATMPDLLAGSEPKDRKVAPFGVHERLLHFLDVELFMADAEKRTYADDLSHKPAPDAFPRDMSDARYQQAGMLPFRVEQCYGQLVKMIRDGRLDDKPGQFPRDEHATKWAGLLAHYAADNTQPHHATLDYKSRSYFPGVAETPDPHGDFEYRLADDEQNDYMPLREEFWGLLAKELEQLKDPIKTDDPWRATIEVSLASYDGLPIIGHAAVAAYKPANGAVGPFDAEAFFHSKGKYHDEEMTVLRLKARQTAWAVLRIERLWRRAWNEAMSKP